MKWAFLTLIKLYWKIIHDRRRRSCIFKESCSHFVYRQTSKYGFFKGINALKLRYQKCRKGYIIYTGINGFEIKLADGCILHEEEISDNILNPIYNKIQKFEELTIKNLDM